MIAAGLSCHKPGCNKPPGSFRTVACYAQHLASKVHAYGVVMPDLPPLTLCSGCGVGPDQSQYYRSSASIEEHRSGKRHRKMLVNPPHWLGGGAPEVIRASEQECDGLVLWMSDSE